VLLRGDTEAGATEDFAASGVFAERGDCERSSRWEVDALQHPVAGGWGCEGDSGDRAGKLRRERRDAEGPVAVGPCVLRAAEAGCAAGGAGAGAGVKSVRT